MTGSVCKYAGSFTLWEDGMWEDGMLEDLVVMLVGTGKHLMFLSFYGQRHHLRFYLTHFVDE